MNFGLLERAVSNYEIIRFPNWLIEAPEFHPSITALKQFIRTKRPGPELSEHFTQSQAYELDNIANDIAIAFPEDTSLEHKLFLEIRALISPVVHISFLVLKKINAELFRASQEMFSDPLPLLDLPALNSYVHDYRPNTAEVAAFQRMQAEVEERPNPSNISDFFRTRNLDFTLNHDFQFNQSEEISKLYNDLSELQQERLRKAIRHTCLKDDFISTWSIRKRLDDFEKHILPLVPMLTEKQATQFFSDFIAALPEGRILDLSINIDGIELILVSTAPTYEAKKILIEQLNIHFYDVQTYCCWLSQQDSHWSKYTLGLILSNELRLSDDFIFDTDELHKAIECFESIPESNPLHADAQALLAHCRLLMGDIAGLRHDSDLGSPCATTFLQANFAFGAKRNPTTPKSLLDHTPIDPYHTGAIVPYSSQEPNL